MRKTTTSARRRALANLPRLESLEERGLLTGAAAVQLLVKFEGGAPNDAAQTLLGALGAEVGESWSSGGTLLSLPSGVDRGAALAQFATTPGVVYAEPNQVGRLAALPTVSSTNPLYRFQWGLNNSDKRADGAPVDADINAPQAWALTQGSSGVIVAVIDSGLDITHPDFSGRLWVNAREVPGNGIDDDRDGFVDDTGGWNFVANSPDVRDDNGHGTHVTGILAAPGTNGGGVVGVDWNARIMPIKAADRNGGLDAAAIIGAINFAANHGAKVINASFGGFQEPSQALLDALNYANTKDVVFVASAGNESNDNDSRPVFPAGVRMANTLSVAAIDRTGALAGFSNFGAQTVDLAAPGVGIWSTAPTGSYDSYPYDPTSDLRRFTGYAAIDGTSMAAPYVAGVVSLVRGLYPNLTASQVVQRILSTVKPLDSLEDMVATGGMIDAYAALVGRPTVVAPPAPPTPTVPLPSTAQSSRLARLKAVNGLRIGQQTTVRRLANLTKNQTAAARATSPLKVLHRRPAFVIKGHRPNPNR